ncbi:phage terminase small subunit [Lysinibacillus fusiformis]|uniref:phage terminase small subunit n=1 Tax=Lysinibacillus fusiformis TaxID=28031 RepID=UPI00263B573F|nr:phage terminase small subunit [Lysinibacillus fusiformis]MDC6268022.1 phage terminase small subunit [Lysinibacillus sphaericus]MDN4967488.1 phage terminase small subunit [Lysinibacillus fusiformis]
MANWDEIKLEWETTKITLADLAEKHDIKLGTLKSRKSREKWSRDATEKDATKAGKVATKEKQVGAPKGNNNAKGNRGNPNPTPKFPKRNSIAEKHGFFSKFLPEETLEIMEAMNERSPADLIWDQIQIQYAAIIRAQKIMHVESKDEMIKELKKAKYDYYPRSKEDGGGVEKAVTEEEYEFQFAWERQAQLLTAQSRAIGELRSSIRQFVEMADQDDERRLKLEQMQLNIDKTKAEIEKLDNKDDGPIEIVIKRKGED